MTQKSELFPEAPNPIVEEFLNQITKSENDLAYLDAKNALYCLPGCTPPRHAFGCPYGYRGNVATMFRQRDAEIARLNAVIKWIQDRLQVISTMGKIDPNAGTNRPDGSVG